jgi:hypothetical protein
MSLTGSISVPYTGHVTEGDRAMATKRKRGSDGHAVQDAYETRLADLKVATRTIGATYEARLAWVVRFIAEDVATWQSATRTAHGNCLLALIEPIPDSFMGGIKLREPMAGADVEALHGELRTMLRDLLNTPPASFTTVTIPTEGRSEKLFRATAAGVKPARFAMSYRDEPNRTGVFQAVKDCILRAGERLHGCPVCGTPFMAVRKQQFCTSKCAQKVRNDKRAPRRKGGSR